MSDVPVSRATTATAKARAAWAVLLLPAALAFSCRLLGDPSTSTGRDAEPRRVDPVLISVPESRFDGQIPIATIYPWIGRYSTSGVQATNGARMAVDDINRAGRIHGRTLKILEYRTGSYFVDVRYSADLAVAAGAIAIIGSNSSSLSMAVAERAESAGVVQISNTSTAQDLTWDPKTGRDRPFIFRVCGPDVEIGALLATFARDHLDAHRVAVLYEIGRRYSAKLTSVFLESFSDPDSGRLARAFPYIAQETDFRPHLKRIAAFSPDVLFIPGSFTDATLVAAQAESFGFHPILLGADGWSNHLLFSRGGPANDAYFGDLCITPGTFRDRYRSRFGDESDGCRAVLAYDAVLAVARALKNLGPLRDEDLTARLPQTRDRLRRAVAKVNLLGQAGRIRFDPHGDIRRGIAVMRVRRGLDGRIQSQLHSWLGER